MNAERPPDVRFQFEHDDSAPRRARAAIDPLVGEPGDPIADDVRLTVSELVTNVVRHTDDGGLLEAWDPKPDVPLRLEVSDSDRTEVLPPPAGVQAGSEFGGHGLHIVDATSDEWGVEPTADGKKVWAEFDRKRRQPAKGKPST
jgi:anti-sigma regulatory factor (Ser/Thr protein kinase)